MGDYKACCLRYQTSDNSHHDPQQQEVQVVHLLQYSQGAWGFHWKDGHKEWKNKQGKKPSVHFYNPANNTVIYCSYLMVTSEESTEKEAKCGDDSQNDEFISLSHSE